MLMIFYIMSLCWQVERCFLGRGLLVFGAGDGKRKFGFGGGELNETLFGKIWSWTMVLELLFMIFLCKFVEYSWI